MNKRQADTQLVPEEVATETEVLCETELNIILLVLRHFISAGISGDKAKEYTNNIIKDLSESEVLNLEYINYLGLENTDGLKFFKYLKNRQPAPIKPKLEAIKDRGSTYFTQVYISAKRIQQTSLWFAPAASAVKEDKTPLFCNNAVSKFAGKKELVQPYWTNLLGSFPINTVSELFDGHKTATLSALKPDLPVYLRGRPRSVFYMIAVGELKGARGDIDEFTNDEKGQMVTYLAELLQIQPTRTSATGFLSEGRIIQFFRLTGSILEESLVYNLHENGGLYLLGLLNTPPLALGIVNVEVVVEKRPVIMNHIMGIGSSAVVYNATFNSETVVAKCFRGTHLSLLEREMKVLSILKSSNLPLLCDKRVPKIVGADNNEFVLLLSPVATQFDEPGIISTVPRSSPKKYANLNSAINLDRAHFWALIDILEFIHKELHLVHRDIKLSNFFSRMDNPDEILLNDWTCAVSIGEENIPFEGSIVHAPKRTFYHRTYTPCIEDDLEMVVKTIFQFLRPTVYSSLVLKTGREIADFWDEQLSAPWWKEGMHHASANNYVELKKWLTGLVL